MSGERAIRLGIAALAGLAAGVRGAETLKLKILSDTSISCHPQEQGLNAGGATALKMKGLENVILLEVDAAPLKGKVVEKAVLFLHGEADRMMVRKVGVSTVAVPWRAGAGRYSPAGADEACFNWPGTGGAWAGPGLGFLDILWGRAGTIWCADFAETTGAGWYAVEMDGRILEACAAGLSYGIAVSDDTGQTMRVSAEVHPESNYGNNFLSSRERGQFAPYIEAVVSPAGDPAGENVDLTVVPWPGGADFHAGGAEISWRPPDRIRDALIGHRIHVSYGGAAMAPVARWHHPQLPGSEDGTRAGVRALVPGLPPGEGVTARVEIVGRGGVIAARGLASGFASEKLERSTPLRLAYPESGAGTPAGTDRADSWAVPDGVKVNPLTGNVLEEPGVDYRGTKGGEYRRANAAWNSADRTVRVSALRGEWAAFQIVCENPWPRAREFSVSAGKLKGPGKASIGNDCYRFWKVWYQQSGDDPRAWYPDPLLPLETAAPFTVPDEANGVPGQTNQTVYVEMFVPRGAESGTYEGEINVRRDGQDSKMTVKLKVCGAVMPEKANFTWSLNAYNSPGQDFGEPMSPDFLDAERSFYAMAHEHRATLAILHYSHSGSYAAAAAPPLEGRGKNMRVADWGQWEKRFEPLLSGEALKGTKRENVPLDHFYLVLSEHYPTKMAEGYRWNDLAWEDHWREAGPVEEGFSEEYVEQWKAVAGDYLAHIRKKGWKTKFHVYLNDKYFYKQYDDKKKSRGQGVSFWLLDEPQHIDDFLALRFFGRMLRQVQNGDRERLIFRVDLSRPEWGRDTIERLTDLNVSGGFFDYPLLLREWRERYGQTIWTYGDSLALDASTLAYSVQALDLYSRGADGYVPWLVLGNEENWRNFAKTCVIYTGKPFAIRGPCPSLRLKAMRRAEQDVEYLLLLAGKRGLSGDDPNRFKLAELLRKALNVDQHLGVLDDQGTVTETYQPPSAADLAAFRMGIINELDGHGGSR